ncbi:MAG: chloride channel protein [Bacteroidales bacterium]|nr:chloride channel protein [Bacteroidales bacterium]
MKIIEGLNRAKNAFRGLSERTLLLVLAIIAGAGSGLAAVILKQLIDVIRHALTSWPDFSQRQWLYLILPGCGMLMAYLIVKYIVRDDISHGVTKVLLAISRNGSKIRAHNMWSSLLTSSITIGFGGSVGAEAPIVYTGAAIGSNIARSMGLSYKNMTILLGCGAAGAVAGVFKAPLAGVLFTMEILMMNISMTSILPLLISSITATLVSYLALGNAVSFSASLAEFSIGNIPYYILLGIFCGLISLYFIHATLKVEDGMRNVHSSVMRWLIGASTLGIMLLLFPPLYGEGYDIMSLLLNGEADSAASGLLHGMIGNKSWFILIFFTCILLFKVFATALTNAAGGVGGTFAPSLFTGCIAGFLVARLINTIGLATLPETNFALVGMAGLMAGVMQAPLTAIFLIAEISGGYTLLFPLIITSAISFATIRITEQYSIYTKRIAASGQLLTHDSDRAVLTLLKTSDLIESDFLPVGIDDSLGDLVKVVAASHRNIFPVVDAENRLHGAVLLDDIRDVMFNRDCYETLFVYNFYHLPPAVVNVDEHMESVMRKFESTDAWNLPVVDDQMKYIGFVSKSKIFSSYREQLQQVSHD